MKSRSTFYKRNLPHWQPRSRPIFITFRLAGSLPKKVVQSHREKKDRLEQMIQDLDINPKVVLEKKRHLNHALFINSEHWLDACSTGPTWLKNSEIANLVCETIHFGNERDYQLHCLTVMPNHVHLLLSLFPEGKDLVAIMHRIKGYSSSKANVLLDRRGPFWQSESFDHVVRSQSLFRKTARYILNNSVKAGLVDDWREWPFCYAEPGLVEKLGMG